LIYTLKDTVAVNKGSHLVKFGVQMNWERPWSESISSTSWGQYNFTGNITGSDMADLLIGIPYKTIITTSRPKTKVAGYDMGVFLQDDFKATPELTVTYGVRLQHYGAPTETNGLFYNFDFENSRVVVPDASVDRVVPVWPAAIPVVGNSAAGYPDSLVNFKSLVIDPRLGLAYKVSDTTVLRAGYGIYHVPFAMAASGVSGLNRAGWLGAREGGPFLGSESFGPNEMVGGDFLFDFQKPFPAPGTGASPKQGVYGIPLNSRSDAWAYDQQWNFTWEQDLGQGWATRVSYVGSKGTSWPYRANLQTPAPSTIPFSERTDRFPYGEQYAFVDLQTLGGNGNYHGLELEATRQFSRGLYLRGWYEIRRNISDVNAGLFSSTVGFPSEDPTDRSRDRGWQNGVSAHRYRIATAWDVPYGNGMRFGSDAPGVAKALLGNWTLAFLIYGGARSHWTPGYSGSDPSNTGRSSGRPDQSCNPNGFGSTPGQLWNAACFSKPPAGVGRFGTAKRGALEGPFYWHTNFNIFKKWFLTGSEKGPYFKMEWYIWNVFNHANTSGPRSTNISAANFGNFVPDSWDSRRPEFRLSVGF
jgi:hypothetical protein